MAEFFRWVVRSRWYVPFVFAVWTLAPELRRFVDYQSSFHKLSVVALMPIAVLVPGLFVIRSQWPLVGSDYRRIVRLWLFAFGYAFLIAIVTGSLLSAGYDAALFTLPLLIGFLVSAAPGENIEVVFERLANAVLWSALVTSLYGIFQYIAPPAWDVYWAQQSGIEGSQGVTTAFGFRIFGTLNSTGPYAAFLGLALVMNIPRLRRSRWWLPLVLAPTFIALAITLVRAEWISLVVSLIVYLALSPARRTVLLSLAGIAGAFVLIVALIFSTVKGSDSALTTVTDRFGTLSNLQDDPSASERKIETQQAFYESVTEPLGQGLGSMGLGAKLAGGTSSRPGGTLDNGFLARFVEMGIVGFALYLLTLTIALAVVFKAYRAYVRGGNRAGANIAAIALAIQVHTLINEIAVDSHNGYPGLTFWLSVYLASAFAAPSGARVPAMLSETRFRGPLRMGGRRRLGAEPLSPSV